MTDYVIGFVWPDKRGLCSCSLVCQDWLPASRHYLFLNIDILPASYDKLVEQLNQSSSMRACLPSVHTFSLQVPPSSKRCVDHLMKGQRFIPDFSGHLPNLRKMEFRMTYFTIKMHPRLHLALHNFRKLQELSLTCCDFDSFNSLRRMLSSLPGLTRLTLRWLSWSSMSPVSFPLRPPHQARPALESLSLALQPPQSTPDPHSLIDWLISLPTPRRISLYMVGLGIEEGVGEPYYLGPLRYMKCLSSPSSVRQLIISPFEIQCFHPDLAALVNLETLELALTGAVYPYSYIECAARWNVLCCMLQGVRAPLLYIRLIAYGSRMHSALFGERLNPVLFDGMEGLDSVLEGKAFKRLKAVTFVANSQCTSSPNEPFDDRSLCSEEPFREAVRVKLPKLYARGITTFPF